MPDDLFADPDAVRADDELVQELLEGTRPPTAGQVEKTLAAWRDDAHSAPLPPVSGWFEDPTAPSGWSWSPDLAALPADSALPAADPDRMPPEHQHNHGGEW